ncbi:MAG: cysteine-rich VLP domain-containing protein [Oscillospiraceae bacterium]|nr:cysteine-rich VLP domain-containing protein [Oscillospiraceae bacterium]
MRTYAKRARELARSERAAIRKLVAGLCANYDWEYGCLLTDRPCYMLGKCWTGGYCKYFKRAVLPADPVLGASLLGREAPIADNCAACDKPFFPKGKQFYCSRRCQAEGNRRKSRERMRKKRQGKRG